MSEHAEPGLTRDGHLLELTAHELLLDELDPARRAVAEAHLAACADCRASLDALRADLAFQLPPYQAEILPFRGPAERLEPARAPAPRRARWLGPLAGGLALAAGLLLFVHRPEPAIPPPEEHLTARGGDWFRVFRADASGAVLPVGTGDAVRPGDRLGFRVQLAQARQVMVLGLDDGGSPYLAWPAAAVGHSQEVPGAPDPTDLNEAVQLDDSPGTERIVALQCERPLSWEQAAAAATAAHPVADVALPALIAGCQQAEVRLRKVSPR